MSDRAKKLRQDARFRALRLIHANPQITQRELSEALGISLGATHYMLRALAKRGFVKAERFVAAKTKSSYAYALTPRGIAEKSILAAKFLARKREEYEALRQEIEDIGAELAEDSSIDESLGGQSADG